MRPLSQRGKAAHLIALVVPFTLACSTQPTSGESDLDTTSQNEQDIVEPGDADLMRVLTDTTDCTLKCKKDLPCYIQCGSIFAKPWTPPCASEVKRKGDGKDTSDYCWAPPGNWCAMGGGQAETKACSADGSQCCKFSETCVPCGWQTCASNKPCTGPNGVIDVNKPGWDATCPDPSPWWQMNACVICEDVLVCKTPEAP